MESLVSGKHWTLNSRLSLKKCENEQWVEQLNLSAWLNFGSPAQLRWSRWSRLTWKREETTIKRSPFSSQTLLITDLNPGLLKSREFKVTQIFHFWKFCQICIREFPEAPSLAARARLAGAKGTPQSATSPPCTAPSAGLVSQADKNKAKKL